MKCSQTPVIVSSFFLLFGLLHVNSHGVADRISIAKCTEYQKLCPPKPTPFNTNGELAAAKEFPHMGLVGYKLDNELTWPCSGILISENFVLTAAHCATSRSHSAQYVRLGDFDLNAENDDAEVRHFDITASFIHPNYTNRNAYNDIALLKLDRTVDFSQYIQPACLPHPDTVISDRVIATGWGKTSMLSEDRPSKLQKVQLNLVPFDLCQERYPPSRRLPEGILNETQLCAGSNVGERDACVGFAGGPLLNTRRKFSCLYETVGITSLGVSCGMGYPGVFTRVTSYIDWIEGVVWPSSNKKYDVGSHDFVFSP